jgi:hypothetical protein
MAGLGKMDQLLTSKFEPFLRAPIIFTRSEETLTVSQKEMKS